jgi:hypothetical protein
MGYSFELRTHQLLVAHLRRHCTAAGYPAPLRLSRSKLHKILRQGELRPHKIRYYVEKRDPDFEIKMTSVLHVNKEVEIVNEYRRGEADRQLGMVTISYDEKPGIQALAMMTPDRPPVVGTHPSHLRDDEYVRPGTVSLLAGLDLPSGRVIENCQRHAQQRRFHRFPVKVGPAPIRSTIKFDWFWTILPRTSPRRRAATYRPRPNDSFLCSHRNPAYG